METLTAAAADPKVKKLEIAEESVRELTDAEADQVTGGVGARRAVGTVPMARIPEGSLHTTSVPD